MGCAATPLGGPAARIAASYLGSGYSSSSSSGSGSGSGSSFSTTVRINLHPAVGTRFSGFMAR